MGYHYPMDSFLKSSHKMALRDWAIDVAVAVVAFACACIQVMLSVSSIIFPDLAVRQYLGLVNVVPEFGVFVALGITTFPLVVRRAFPWPTLLFVLVAHCALQNVYPAVALSPAGVLVALFTAAAMRPGREAVAAALVVAGGLLLFPGQFRTPSLAFFVNVQNVALVVAAAAAGYGFRIHRAYVRETERRAAEAERTREEEAARRVEEERVRIAREVHDITAHSLSAVSVQTAAAERLIDRDPQAAKEAISAARATAKSALDDIRSMIGVLRHGDAPAETSPTAGTDRLADLAAYLKDAGIACRIDDSAYLRAEVPAHVDLALFAIAREAATNMVKHSHASHAVFTLASDGGQASLEVLDDGVGGGVPVSSGNAFAARKAGGNGVVGMAERARLLGGALSAGDAPQGGFVVRASIPLAVDAEQGREPASPGKEASHGE